MAPLAWVGSRRGHFHHNTVYLPEECSGVYRVDPELELPGTSAMRAGSVDRRLEGIGADTYRPQ